jgi:hypothetical protein
MNAGKNSKSEEIINSIDGIKRATAPEFFYTRLKARMEKEILPSTRKSPVLRPVFIVYMLAVVLMLNAAVILSGKKSTSPVVASSNSETEALQSIAAEYNPTDFSSLYDLNENR